MQIADQLKTSPWRMMTAAGFLIVMILYVMESKQASDSTTPLFKAAVLLVLAFPLVWFIHTFTGEADKNKRAQQVQFAYFFALASFALVAVPPMFKGQAVGSEPVGIISGCVPQTDVEALRCIPQSAEQLSAPQKADFKGTVDNRHNQWLVNIGGALTQQVPCPEKDPQCEKDPEGGRYFISGGLVIPLPVIIVALFGAAISLSRRVPEIQKQSEEEYIGTSRQPALTLNEAREHLAFQIMQFVSAPVIAITAYQVLRPTNESVAIALAFMAGFGSETILLLIRGVAEGIQPKTTSTAVAERVGNVEGVISAHGKPMTADVTVRGTNLKTTSDTQGKYTFKQIPAGNQIISVLNKNTIHTRDVFVVAGATNPCDIDIDGNEAEELIQRQSDKLLTKQGTAISAPVTVDIRMAIDNQDLDPGTLCLHVDAQQVNIADDGMVELSLQPGLYHRITASATKNGVELRGERTITVSMDDDGRAYSLNLE
jgi:hypothetical protein